MFYSKTSISIIFIIWIILIYCVYKTSKFLAARAAWQKISSSFVEEVNSVGGKLNPGDFGIVRIMDVNADELILISSYQTRNDINNKFNNREQKFINDILSISWDEHKCPALVWVRNGKVVSVNRANFKIGVNINIHVWNLRKSHIVKIHKEKMTTNHFLSINFME